MRLNNSKVKTDNANKAAFYTESCNYRGACRGVYIHDDNTQQRSKMLKYMYLKNHGFTKIIHTSEGCLQAYLHSDKGAGLGVMVGNSEFLQAGNRLCGQIDI